MHNQGDRSKSLGQVQTHCMSDDTEEIEGLPLVEHDGRLKLGSFQTAFVPDSHPLHKEQTASCKRPKSKRVGHADVPGAKRLEESVRPLGQKQSARSIGRTRSGKGAHGMDLKVMGAAHTGDEAGPHSSEWFEATREFSQAASESPLVCTLLVDTILTKPNKKWEKKGKLRLSAWIIGISRSWLARTTSRSKQRRKRRWNRQKRTSPPASKKWNWTPDTPRQVGAPRRNRKYLGNEQALRWNSAKRSSLSWKYARH